MPRFVQHPLAQTGPAMAAILRCDPRVVRKLPAALILVAAGLTAWVFELGAVLQGQAVVRDWSSVWVGLDLLEIAGLVLTALLIKRRSAFLPSAAAATATLFGLDAWFDVLTSAAGAAWYESLAAALLGEIPLTIVLAAISLWSAKTGSGARPGAAAPGPVPTPRMVTAPGGRSPRQGPAGALRRAVTLRP